MFKNSGEPISEFIRRICFESHTAKFRAGRGELAKAIGRQLSVLELGQSSEVLALGMDDTTGEFEGLGSGDPEAPPDEGEGEGDASG